MDAGDQLSAAFKTGKERKKITAWQKRSDYQKIETNGSYAGIAQLVEHHVANVNVAGSSPVSRSTAA
jgi:hypothetical protein